MERTKIGIKALDEMLDGGLIPGSITVIKGAPGTGKTTLGLQFLAAGASRYAEPGLLVSFEEFPQQLQRDGASIGVDLAALEADGRVKVLFTTPQVFVEELSRPGGEFDNIIASLGVQRVMIDSITHLERLETNGLSLRETVYAFLNGLKRYEASVVVMQEDTVITGNLSTLDYGLSYMVDTIIQLRYVEVDSEIKRALFILKQRASNHDKAIHEYQIDKGGIRIEPPFKDREGLLSGSPSLIGPRVFLKAFGKP